MTKQEGYRIGIEHIGDVVKWCKDANVTMLTMWGFSTDNFKRDEEEIGGLFNLFKKNLLEGLQTKEKEGKKIKVMFFGRKHLFPREIRALFDKIEEKTKDNGPYQLNLLLSYGGREEIVDAVNEIIAEGIEKVDEKIISDHVYTKGLPDPDLIIRTSGEKRLSGLMPWQSCYSEFYFCEKLWPDFSENDFKEALEDFARRKRRYGK
ncbi:di-trans,poly-cis-decaprenylcistransferase [Candidatus Micrarchaeota archaeon]|nr:di-trans,poly-cis-decaprenylcistransferase [Candidatus Micrarchaeota archaeon]MBU1166064.1 di-trans,poly-cis-decaprenylcistransferase [Candidatus Micrarchaeota archaeon]MBU1886162.1 di-trans,poly-cis-decaprenylcistransferase [Candidatus Micrarchaeota archaeon]